MKKHIVTRPLKDKKVHTRKVFGEKLRELGSSCKEIIGFSADLAGSTNISKFGEKFSSRFFNMGIAEQNMICTAAGAATCGKIPVVSTFAMFETGRCWEQIRQSVCIPNLNVKLVSTHGGITVGPDGASHQCIEDIGIMRLLPNMRVIVPVDAFETKKVIEYIVNAEGPFYVRLSRSKTPLIFDETLDYQLGESVLCQEGDDVTIIACGIMVEKALLAADILEKDNISARVINMSSIKPIDEKAVCHAAEETGAIVSAEEHLVTNGLGSAIAEVLGEYCPVPMKRIGMNDTFGLSGSPEELMEHFGLTPEKIADAAKSVIERKNTS